MQKLMQLSTVVLLGVIATALVNIWGKFENGTATMFSASAAPAGGPILGGKPAPYQQYAYTNSCNSNGYCGLTFPAVTPETLISQVTCWLDLGNANGVSGAYLSNGGGGAATIVNYLPVTSYSFYGGYTYYVINAQTQMFLSSGQQPTVYVSNNVGTITVFECSVSGYASSALLAQPGTTTTPPAAGPPPSPRLPPYIRVPAQ
jgi:hypothetical protein